MTIDKLRAVIESATIITPDGDINARLVLCAMLDEIEAGRRFHEAAHYHADAEVVLPYAAARRATDAALEPTDD